MKMRNVEIALMGYFDGEVSPFNSKVITAFLLYPRYSRKYLRDLRTSHDEFISLIAQKKGQPAEDNKSLVNDIFRQLPHCSLIGDVTDKAKYLENTSQELRSRGARFAHFGRGFMIGSVASALVLIGINGLGGGFTLFGQPKQISAAQTSPEVSANAEYFNAEYLSANYEDESQKTDLAQGSVYNTSEQSVNSQMASLPVTSVSNSQGQHPSLTLANNIDESVQYSGDGSLNINNNIYFRYQPQTPATIDSLRITHESLTWENLAR